MGMQISEPDERIFSLEDGQATIRVRADESISQSGTFPDCGPECTEATFHLELEFAIGGATVPAEATGRFSCPS